MLKMLIHLLLTGLSLSVADNDIVGVTDNDLLNVIDGVLDNDILGVIEGVLENETLGVLLIDGVIEGVDDGAGTHSYEPSDGGS